MKTLIFLIALALSMQAFAQNITGKVVDGATKEPLPGVNILAQKSNSGTTTSLTGDFTLEISADDVLMISCLGYKKQVLNVTPGSESVITLAPAPIELNNIIVSANREAQQRTEAPVAISTISKNVLIETKPYSLDQVLNKASGVYMVDLGNEQHSMAIRQPMSYKSLFLYLEDGIPIRANGDFNHNALVEINMAALKTVEIIRGPASSLYGSEAIGGAVNFITLAPTVRPSGKLQLQAHQHGYKRTDFSASNNFNKFGFVLSGYYADQSNGYRDHSDFNKLALTLRTDYTFSNYTRLITSASFINYHTDQTGGIDSASFYGRKYISFHTFTYRKVDAFRLRSTLEHRWNRSNHTNFTAFYRNSSIEQNPFYAIRTTSDPLKARGEINKDHFNSYGIVGQHTSEINFLNTKFIAGISADYNPLTYKANYIDVDKNAEGFYTGYTRSDSLLTNYNADILNTAAYTQIEVSPIERLKLVAGLRFDRLDYKFDNHLEPSAYTGAPDEINSFHHLTPKLGLTYNLRDLGFYGNYSIGFAPPQITEMYRGVQVPVLKPATYTNYEVGSWITFADGKATADLSIYQLDGRNEIISVKLEDGSYENQNAGITRHRGIEYSIQVAPVRDVVARFSGANSEHIFVEYNERGNEFSGKYMNAAPSFIGNAEITYKPAFIKGFRVGLEWQRVSEYFMDAANTEKYEGYHIFNLRTGYTFKGFEVWVNVLNLFDEVHATVVEKSAWGHSYRPGCARMASVGFAYNFTGKNR